VTTITFPHGRRFVAGEPRVPVTVSGPAREINVMAVVDTGAMTCVFPRALLARCGYTLTPPSFRTMTAGGAADFRAAAVHLHAFDVLWRYVPVLAGDNVPALLGRNLLDAVSAIGYQGPLQALHWR